jgi:hypothetical protein
MAARIAAFLGIEAVAQPGLRRLLARRSERGVVASAIAILAMSVF